jgi:cobalt-zinc-cadmium efflux system outer membrane protein
VKFRTTICICALLAGCARFTPKPILPEKTAADLESRSLTNVALKHFLETNLHSQFTNWPPAQWNFEMLTLATFYYQPNLEVARAQWKSAQAGIETAGARPNPSVSATAAYNSDIPSISPWMPSVSFDVPIETAGKRQRRMEQARHLSDSARLNIASAAWQARGELRDALADFISSRDRARLLSQQLKLQEELDQKLRQQVQAGAISTSDLLPADLAFAKAKADLGDAESQLAQARVRVAAAIGVPVSALGGVEVEFEFAGNTTTDRLTSAEARRAALLGRADILAALADYAAVQSALQLEIAKQYPDVHLSPGYAWNQNQTGDNQWQLGLTLDLPLLNQNQGPIAEAEAHRNEVAAKFLALQMKVIGEIDRALAMLDAARKNLDAIKAVTAAQARQRDLAESQFKAGAAERVDVLTAEISFQSSSVLELDARLKLQQAIGALEDAVQRPLSGEFPIAAIDSNTNADPARRVKKGTQK